MSDSLRFKRAVVFVYSVLCLLNEGVASSLLCYLVV